MSRRREREPAKVTKMLPFEAMGSGSGREKIDRVERGDDLATDHQLLQIVAIAEVFVRQDAEPEVIGN